MLSRSDGGRLAVSSCSFAQLETNFVSSSISAGIVGRLFLQSFANTLFTPSVELLSDHDVVKRDSQRDDSTQHVTRVSADCYKPVKQSNEISCEVDHRSWVTTSVSEVSSAAGASAAWCCFRCRPSSYQLTCYLLPPPCYLPEPREREESLPALQGSLFFLRPLRGSLFEQGAWLASSSLEPRPQGSRKLRCSSKPGHACSSFSSGGR